MAHSWSAGRELRVEAVAVTRVVLAQLPLTRLEFGARTGNIPLAGACLAAAAAHLSGIEIHLLPESETAYLGDAALVDRLLAHEPDVVGFTVFNWNLKRSRYLTKVLKKARPGVKIVFGGPEITPDNPVLAARDADAYVIGDGELAFARLLGDLAAWPRKLVCADASGWFCQAPSPYLQGLLESGIDNLMLLETQRGCPYGCAYCYYHKSRRKPVQTGAAQIMGAIDWARDRQIPEIYLLDPAFNTRPDLEGLLADIAAANPHGQIAFNSEIRAEGLTSRLADLYRAAGFTFFEIGLQTTNRRALDLMHRKGDPAKVAAGARLLKERGIAPHMDLILGLPGDDLAGFKQSVDFLVQNEIAGNVQIFFLAILPGTEFRRRSRELGICFDPEPPYTVRQTPGFSAADLARGLAYAEDRLETTFFLPPDLDIAHQMAGNTNGADVLVRLGNRPYIAKLVLFEERPLDQIQSQSRCLTQPYQVFFGPRISRSYQHAALRRVTTANPHTPLEIVWIEPDEIPEPRRILDHAQLDRPLFLDLDLRYLYPRPGNRSIQFTLVSARPDRVFSGEMRRQVLWWRRSHLPTARDLAPKPNWDGILLDTPLPDPVVADWQKHFAPRAGDMLWVSFRDIEQQQRWKALTLGDAYWMDLVYQCPSRNGRLQFRSRPQHF